MDTETWKARAEAVTDAELAEFRRRICVHPEHIGLAAIGTCGRCGGATSSCSMRICGACARELGVCAFDQLMTGWGSVSNLEREAIAARWLALLMRGYAAERTAAMRALESWPDPQVAAAARDLESGLTSAPVGRSPTPAEFVVGFERPLPAEILAGARFLDATVVRVDPALGHVTVRTTDAARFEARALRVPGVRFVQLDRALTELPD